MSGCYQPVYQAHIMNKVQHVAVVGLHSVVSQMRIDYSL
jgi:hypothetical protein